MKSINNLPYLIFLWWVFMFFLTDTDFYRNNFHVINFIDLPFIAFSLSHFIFHNKKYKLKKAIFVYCIVLVLILQNCYNYIDENTYYAIYSTILILTIYAKIIITDGYPKRDTTYQT